jgi:5-methylcytosine-specific restriction endonuclease McrA
MLKGRVLLLNKDFSALGTIGVARAIRMTMRDENPVHVEQYVPNSFLTTGRGEKIPVPSVIVLNKYVNIVKERRESASKREKIYLRDRYKCQYCPAAVGKKHPITKKIVQVRDLTLDHIFPRSRGGANIPTNLATSCKPCNQRKDNRTPEEARMPLRTEIHDISAVGISNLMLCKYVEHHEEWLPYLEGKDGFVETYQNYLSALKGHSTEFSYV